MLELKKYELATEEDKAWGLDKWARFFKAKTWEEIKMLAKEEPAIKEAAGTVYKISQDKRIRQLCEAREEYIRDQNTTKRLFEMQAKEKKNLEKQLEDQSKRMKNQQEQMEKKDKDIEEQKQKLREQSDRIKQLEEALSLQREISKK